MMNAHRAMTMALAVTAAAMLCGCVPGRRETYDMLRRERQRAYAEWAAKTNSGAGPLRISGPLSLEKAVGTALDNNPALRAELEEEERARGQVVESYAEALPTLSLSAAYSHGPFGTAQGAGGPAADLDKVNNWSGGLTLTQPIYKGGAIGAALRAARYFSTLSEENVRRQVQDTIASVAEAYYDVLLAEKLLVVQQYALEFVQHNLDDVRARVKAGVAIHFDQLRAEVEVSNVEADLIRQENQLDRARTRLLRLMGVSQRSDVELTDKDALDYVPLNPAFEDAVRTAFMNRPELHAGELNVQLQEEYLATVMSRFWPTLEGWAGQTWYRPTAAGHQWEDYWAVGLRLRWDLFTGLSRRGQAIQARAELRQSIIRLLDTEQAVLEEVKNAMLDLQSAENLIRSQEKNVARALEAGRLIEAGVKEGVNTALEALDARTALTRAAGLESEAEHQHAVARLRLQRALGLMGRAPGSSREIVPPYIKNPSDLGGDADRDAANGGAGAGPAAKE